MLLIGITKIFFKKFQFIFFKYSDQDYRAADGFIMVFDVSSTDSFLKLRSVVAKQIAAVKGKKKTKLN